MKALLAYRLLSHLAPVALIILMASCSEGSRPESILLKRPVKTQLLGAAQYTVTRSGLGVDELSDVTWQRTPGSNSSYGAGPDDVWFRMTVRNESPRTEWHLVSAYAWIDTIEVFVFQDGRETFTNRGGDAIPYARREVPHRLPVVPVVLPKGESVLLIRVTSDAERVLSFSLQPNARIGYDFPRDIYQELVRFTVVAALLSLGLATYTRQGIYILYALGLTWSVAYFGIWEGYGHVYLYPESPGYNDSLQYATGFVAATFLMVFWRRQLMLAVQAPRWNVALIGLSIGLFMFAIVMAFQWIPFGLADVIGRSLALAMAVTTFGSGLSVIRIRFVPGYYAFLGFFLLVATIAFWMVTGVWFVPANDYTIVMPYPAIAIQFALFMVSIVSRSRLLGALSAETRIIGDHSPATNKGYSRLRRFDLPTLTDRLRHLMEVERLFCDDDLTLERLADLMGLSRHQLSELIGQVFQKSFHGYRNELRIKEAKRLLVEEPGRTILSVAMAVGFSAKSSFNEVFRARTGKTPSAYRKECAQDRNRQST